MPPTEAVLGEMVEAVEAVLAEIGAGELPVELVLNKIDAVDEARGSGSPTAFPALFRSPPTRETAWTI